MTYPKIHYPTPYIRDLVCTGYNPLRCDICQKKHKYQSWKTCEDEICVKEYEARHQ